jgi:hypothetical protein
VVDTVSGARRGEDTSIIELEGLLDSQIVTESLFVEGGFDGPDIR